MKSKPINENQNAAAVAYTEFLPLFAKRLLLAQMWEDVMGNTMRSAHVTCSECNWTNVSLINLGEPGKPRWVCHGCCKRTLEALDSVHAALPKNPSK